MGALANDSVIELERFLRSGRKKELEDRTDDQRRPSRCSLAGAKEEDHADPNEKRRVQNDLFAPALWFLVPSF
jgi:hypothetical protein